MQAEKEKEARSIAVAAVAQGWLDGGAVWDAAVRFARAEGRATAEELFAPVLVPERLAALSAPGGETGGATMVAHTTTPRSPRRGTLPEESLLVRDALPEVGLRPPDSGREPLLRAAPAASPPGATGLRYLLGDSGIFSRLHTPSAGVQLRF